MASFKPDYQRKKPPRYSYFRQFIPYLALLVFFSFFLTSLGLLTHFRSPARKQQIGWQSWDVVENHLAKGSGKANGTEDDGGFAPSIPLEAWVSRWSAVYVATSSLSQDPLAVQTTGRMSPSAQSDA